MSVTGSLSPQFAPVILGSGPQNARIALRLFRQYGLVSHMIAPRISLFCRLTPWLICHTLTVSATELIVHALLDLAAEIEESGRTPLLYLGNGTPPFTPMAISTLETAFILYRQEISHFCNKKGEQVS